MAYRFIEAHQREFGIRWMLKKMGICPNAYYNYLKHKKTEYHEQKESICNEIKVIDHETVGILGHRRIRIFLARKGIYLSKTTVHKYMNKELRLLSICRRKRPEYKKGHVHKVFPNLLKQDFTVDSPNKVWCTDFTYIALANGAIRYNCTIIDLYDRSVVSSQTGRWITSELAIETLQKALSAQKIIPKNLILHSDQGTQFTSSQFTMFCKEHDITQSMSRAGCPYDNAPMERYYNSLKEELIRRYHFRTDNELSYAISEYAYKWYNQIRPHSFNDYKTPFEQRYHLARIR